MSTTKKNIAVDADTYAVLKEFADPDERSLPSQVRVMVRVMRFLGPQRFKTLFAQEGEARRNLDEVSESIGWGPCSEPRKKVVTRQATTRAGTDT